MTNFLDWLLGRSEPPAEPSRALMPLGVHDGGIKAVPGGAWLNSLQQGPLLSAVAMTPQQRAAAHLRAYKVGWFYKAERKISTDIGMLKRTVSPEVDGDNEREVIEPDVRTPFDSLDPIGQFLRLMERPNDRYTGRALFTKTQIRLDMAGWAFWYLEGADFGLPTAIYGISPSRMWPEIDKQGNLVGWTLDKNSPSGGLPFSTREILPFTTATADDEDWYGQGVVEAVQANVPLSELMARHTADVLHTGGRLAGMMWPRERSLDEAEYQDALRAWRNVTSDPNAARRLLIFPEPMEYAQGASTPAEIGIPELAELDMTTVLTAFPVDPTMLGYPMPSGLNASGETRKELRNAYWSETIHPRVELLEETIQVGLLSRYEEKIGGSWDFDIEEPNLDDATSLISKVEALKGLISVGFDPKEAVAAVVLDGIKWNGLPELIDPAKQAEAQRQEREARAEQPAPTFGKATKARAEQQRDQAFRGEVPEATTDLAAFFNAQRERLIENISSAFPKAKSARSSWTKADPEWWDAKVEDAALQSTLRGLYVRIGRAGLQAVADTLERTILKNQVNPIVDDLLAYGGDRITGINATTKAAVQQELAEGVRRGYSLNQIIEGNADEAFSGIRGVLLDNGTPAFGELRSETIARTETMLSYNRASVQGYGQFGVERMLAYDGDDDAECASRDGMDFTIAEALSIEDHPNGTLVFSPLI